MICITGDTHGELSRFNDRKIRRLKKGDFLIICGDFGFLWQGTARERAILKAIGRKPFTTLFVDGCHENYTLLEEYPVEEWNGGLVRNISGRLYRLERGCVYQLGLETVFAFGGGHSDDGDIRREMRTWWPQEIATEEELARGRASLESHGYQVDYICTHEAPASVMDFLHIKQQTISECSAFFDIVRRECRFKKWFFGKCHINKTIPPQFFSLFDDTILLE